jgi:hypothetical protein
MLADQRQAKYCDAMAEAKRAQSDLNVANQIIYDLTDGITGTLQRDEIERLRAALAPIAGFPDWPERGDHELTAMRITFGHLRALRAALALPQAERS